jgi:hypothetical protein
MDSIMGYKFNNIHNRNGTVFYTIVNNYSDMNNYIYFSELEDIHKLPNYHIQQMKDTFEHLYTVKISNDSTVFYESYIYKTNEYKLSEKILLRDSKKILELMKNHNNPYIIKFVDFEKTTENISIHELCIQACIMDGFTLHYISKQQKEKNIFSYLQYELLCIEACKQNGLALRFVLYQSDNICIIACSNNGYALKYVVNQTEQICIEACNKNGLALIYVENQTYNICISACKSNGLSLQYVFLPNSTLNKIACSNNGMALEFVRIQTREICNIACKQNKDAHKFIKKNLYN